MTLLKVFEVLDICLISPTSTVYELELPLVINIDPFVYKQVCMNSKQIFIAYSAFVVVILEHGSFVSKAVA